MSMMPLNFFAGLAIRMMALPLRVQDVVYLTADGVDSQQTPTERVIQAALDASNSRRLEQIFGGSVSDGSIGIFTSEKLYFTDTTPSGSDQRQSFVYYGDYQYRVTTVADWKQQAGTYVYLAERHITQDLV
jgi:hypothetical protein